MKCKHVLLFVLMSVELIHFFWRLIVCGRFVQATAIEKVRLIIDIANQLDSQTNFNIAPSTAIACVRQLADGSNHLGLMRWGLIPTWAKDIKTSFKTFNARAETLKEKASFKAAYKYRRCIIPADGYYEWHTENNKKQPYFIYHSDQQPLLLAGLWELWQHDGMSIESATIITTAASQDIQFIHPRMPVVLTTQQAPQWLDVHQQDSKQCDALLHAQAGLKWHRVDPKIGNPRFNNDACIQAIAG